MWDWDGDFPNHAPAKTIQARNISDVIKGDTFIVHIVHMHMCVVYCRRNPLERARHLFTCLLVKILPVATWYSSLAFVATGRCQRFEGDVIIDLRRWHRLPLCSTGCRMSPRDFTQLDVSQPTPPTHPTTTRYHCNISIMRMRTPLRSGLRYPGFLVEWIFCWIESSQFQIFESFFDLNFPGKKMIE